ncbi:MAG: PaaI family thioesterase [Acidobacteria bacterium]|nr:PaaI family thioesterase [Acidobacteriota bacterium]
MNSAVCWRAGVWNLPNPDNSDIYLMSSDDKTTIRLSRNTQHCYVCGPQNQAGLHVLFTRDGERGARGEYVAQPEHCGWPGMLHGGITFALMDEALAYALYFQGMFGVTAKAETRFREPIPAGAKVIIRAWVVAQRRRLVTAHAEIHLDDVTKTVLAETEATMFLQEAELQQEAPFDSGATAS